MACPDGQHEFREPVIIKTTERSFLFVIYERIDKEIMVSMCQKCGEMIAYGWGLGNEDG